MQKASQKKSQRRHHDPLPNRLAGITWMPALAKEQHPWSLKLNCQTWLPNRDLSVRSTSNMPLQQENPWFCPALWISACISTGWDVGKVDLCPQADFYPKQVRRGYNACAPTFLDAKSMIFIRYTDLSTKKWAFTIITIFMYTSLFKTQRQTRTVEKSPERLSSTCFKSCNL